MAYSNPEKRTKDGNDMVVNFFNLQEINNDVQLVSSYVSTLRSHFNAALSQRSIHLIDDSSWLTNEGYTQHLVHEVKRLREELYEIVEAVTNRRESNSKELEQVVRLIATQLSSFLPPTTLALLSASSKSMFTILKPFISLLLSAAPPLSSYPSSLPSRIPLIPPFYPLAAFFYYRQVEKLPFRQPRDAMIFTHLQPATFVDVRVCEIPSHVSRVTFSDGFNHGIKNLPSTLTCITFGKSFMQLVDNLLPPSVTHLTFGDSFNKSVNSLPNSITHLTFGHRFNRSVPSLPRSITHLTFGFCFSKPLDNPPPALKVLKLGFQANNPIDFLPNTIHTLKVDTKASINYLPSSLTFLDTSLVETKVTCSLPPSLTHLSISDIHPHQLSILPSLSRLETNAVHFTPGYDSLPPTLTHLVIAGDWTGTLDFLPPLLTHLDIQSTLFNTPLDHLPRSLTHLSLGEAFNLPLANPPPGLSHLTFGYSFNIKVDNIPPNVTHLTFGTKFNSPVDHLPCSLTHLQFGMDFNQSVDHLPPYLLHLRFAYYFNCPVNHLPSHLTHLSFGYSFNHPVDRLPSSIKRLTLGICFHRPIHHLPHSISHLTMVVFYNGSLQTLNQILNFPSHYDQVNLLIACDYRQFKPRMEASINYDELMSSGLGRSATNQYALALSLKKHRVEWEWMSTYKFSETLFFVEENYFL